MGDSQLTRLYGVYWQRTLGLMMSLRDQLIRLAHADAELRPHVLPLLLAAESPLRVAVRRLASDIDLQPHLLLSLMRTADEEGEGGKGKGRASGKFIQFIEEEGDKRVTNPDTGNNVKIKSLRGPKGKELAKDLFRKWLDSKKEKKAPSKSKKDEDEEPQETAKPEPKKTEPKKTEPKKTEPKKTEEPEKKEPEDKSENTEPKTETEESKPSKFPTLTLKKDRYKKTLKTDLYISLKAKPKAGDRLRPAGPKGKAFIEAVTKAGTKMSEQTVADLVGGPILAATNEEHNLQVSNDAEGLRVEMRGPHIKRMVRILGSDDDGPYIYNDTLSLDDSAPKGLGTKIFATQVAQARAAGVKKIKCSAFRHPEDATWVGYKVWPKLGYDGEVPEHVASDIPETLQKKIKDAGFKKPLMVSHLYQVDGGSAWWDENGDTFEASFDLADGSTSMKVLQAYLEEKAKKADTSPEDWMSKIAAKKKDKGKDKKKDEAGHENIDLDDHDNEVLDAIWKNLRKKG